MRAIYHTLLTGLLVTVLILSGCTAPAGQRSITVTERDVPASVEVPAAAPAPTGSKATPTKATVTVTSITSPVRRGATATVVALTSPEAGCDIDVLYKSGASKAAGLYPKKADAQGRVSWSWMVGTRTTSGTWPVMVTCDGVTARTTILVQ